MTDFTDAYVNLLIKQYWEKPNARSEIEAQAATWERVSDFLGEFPEQFDLDASTEDRLDIIGKIVGLHRNRPEFTDDDDYRFFLRVKIAKNTASAFMVSDDRQSLQDVIQFAFSGLAYVIDKQNMSLTLYVSPDIDLALLQLILDIDLLPKPQAVRYDVVIQSDPDETFGFAENPEAKGFADKFDPAFEGGLFADKVLI